MEYKVILKNYPEKNQLWVTFTKLEKEWQQPFKSVRNWAVCQYKAFKQIRTIWTGFKFKLAAVCSIPSCSSGSNLEDVGGIRFEAADGNIGAFGSQDSIACLLFLLLGREIIRLKPHPKTEKQQVVVSVCKSPGVHWDIFWIFIAWQVLVQPFTFNSTEIFWLARNLNH